MKYLILALSLVLSFSSIAKNAEVELTVKIYKDVNKMKKEIRQRGKSFEGNLKGFAIFSPNDNKCEIFVLHSERERIFEQTLGHELRHCIYGNFHN